MIERIFLDKLFPAHELYGGYMSGKYFIFASIFSVFSSIPQSETEKHKSSIHLFTHKLHTYSCTQIPLLSMNNELSIYNIRDPLSNSAIITPYAYNVCKISK